MITENTLRTRIEVAPDGRLTATLEGVAQGVEKIDKAQQGQADSAAVVASSSQASAEATRAVGESAAEAEARIKAMVQASLQRQQAEQAQITSSMRSVDATKVVNQSINDQVAAHQRAIAAADAYRQRSAAASRAAGNTAGIDEQREALHKLLGEIDPTISALDKLDKQQAKLAGFKKSGLLSDDDFARFNQAIDGGRERINSAGEAMSHFSLNTAMARRELGYMMKDLATGQFGRFQQSALTLASSSGLMAAAFTPLGLAIGAAAAAVGLFGLAAVKGEQDSERLRVSVIATGEAAGVSAAQYDSMASSVGAATGQWGYAREAIEQFAASGQVAGAGLGMLGKQAVDMATVTGKSIDESVAKILELGQRPADTIAKLNEQYHFLTAAQYAQIAALEAEGNARAAARLANELDATAMAARAKEVEDNANWMVKSAHLVAAEWGKAWNAMKGESGNGALADQAKALEDQIDHWNKLKNEGVKFDPNSGRSLDEMIGTKSKSLDAIRHRQAQGAFDANAQQLDALANADAIAAQRRLSAYASPQDKRDSALKQAAADRLAAMYGVVDPDVRARIQAEYEDQVKTANNNYNAAVKRLAGPKAAKSPETSAYATFQSQVDALNVKTITGDDAALTQYQQGIARLADQMGVYMSKGGDATKAAELFNRGQQDLQKTLDANTAKNVAGQKAYAAALAESNAALQQQVNNEVARIGMGDKEYQRAQTLAKLQQDEARQLAQLALHRNDNAKNRDNYEADVEALKAATDEKVRIQLDGFQRVDAAQGDWTLGARSALLNYADDAADVAGQTRDMFSNAFDGMGESLTSFVTTGKGGFSDLVDSIVSDLVRMEARILVSQVLESVLGVYMGSYGAGGSNAFSSVGTDASGGSIDFVSHVGGRATGGRINGPGTGTSDSILARVSTGENVITASATDYYGQSFMDALNAKQLPRFAGGGRVGGGGGGYAGQPAPQITVINNAGADVKASAQQQPDGSWMAKLVIDTVSGDIANGGKSAKAMQQRFGLQRRGVPVGG